MNDEDNLTSDAGATAPAPEAGLPEAVLPVTLASELETATVAAVAHDAQRPEDAADANESSQPASPPAADVESGSTGEAEPSDAQSHEPQAQRAEPKARRSRAAAPRRTPKRPPPLAIQVDETPPKMDWYILKVQSNREDSIREALLRKVAIAGLDHMFGEIIVPIEKVSEFKNGKKRVVKRKLYPGYLVANMVLNDETWFLVRETPGIGDFTGSGGKPSPMLAHEVSRIVKQPEDKAEEGPKLKINFKSGDRVKITTGTFENFEGEVDSIDEANGRVTVMINIFGRSTPVEIDYWEIEGL